MPGVGKRPMAPRRLRVNVVFVTEVIVRAAER
jgi:hypothetical protein